MPTPRRTPHTRTHASNPHTHPHTHRPTHLPTHLRTIHLSTYPPIHLSTYPPTYLPTLTRTGALLPDATPTPTPTPNQALFYTMLTPFLAFFGSFAAFIYPVCRTGLEP